MVLTSPLLSPPRKHTAPGRVLHFFQGLCPDRPPHEFVERPLLHSVLFDSPEEGKAAPLQPAHVDFIPGIHAVPEDRVPLLQLLHPGPTMAEEGEGVLDKLVRAEKPD